MLGSEDMDVYVQAAYVSQQLWGDLLIKHKNALINCCDMLLEKVVDVIILIHIITGSGHTSACYGHEKINGSGEGLQWSQGKTTSEKSWR